MQKLLRIKNDEFDKLQYFLKRGWVVCEVTGASNSSIDTYVYVLLEGPSLDEEQFIREHIEKWGHIKRGPVLIASGIHNTNTSMFDDYIHRYKFHNKFSIPEYTADGKLLPIYESLNTDAKPLVFGKFETKGIKHTEFTDETTDYKVLLNPEYYDNDQNTNIGYFAAFNNGDLEFESSINFGMGSIRTMSELNNEDSMTFGAATTKTSVFKNYSEPQGTIEKEYFDPREIILASYVSPRQHLYNISLLLNQINLQLSYQTSYIGDATFISYLSYVLPQTKICESLSNISKNQNTSNGQIITYSASGETPNIIVNGGTSAEELTFALNNLSKDIQTSITSNTSSLRTAFTSNNNDEVSKKMDNIYNKLNLIATYTYLSQLYTTYTYSYICYATSDILTYTYNLSTYTYNMTTYVSDIKDYVYTYLTYLTGLEPLTQSAVYQNYAIRKLPCLSKENTLSDAETYLITDANLLNISSSN